MNTNNKPYREELIGTTATIVHATNAHQHGFQGKIIDETRNLLIFEQNKKFHKKSITIRIQNDQKTQEIDGSALLGRPEDRLKKTRP